MMSRLTSLAFALAIMIGGATFVCAQEEQEPLIPNPRAHKDEPPRGIDEALTRMRIEKEKRTFNDMIRHGDEARKLADQLKEDDGVGQREQIVNIGKLVKKVREELGGEGSSDDDDAVVPKSNSEAVKALKQEVASLTDDLKKVTRFTVSAAAIERTNTILRLVKFLHG